MGGFLGVEGGGVLARAVHPVSKGWWGWGSLLRGAGELRGWFGSSWAVGRQEFQSLPQGLFMHFIQGSLHIDMCKQSLEQGLEFQPLPPSTTTERGFSSLCYGAGAVLLKAAAGKVLLLPT